jgi:hypothetical protein
MGYLVLPSQGGVSRGDAGSDRETINRGREAAIKRSAFRKLATKAQKDTKKKKGGEWNGIKLSRK